MSSNEMTYKDEDVIYSFGVIKCERRCVSIGDEPSQLDNIMLRGLTQQVYCALEKS